MNIIVLKGGLGNQLFQLCLYLNIAKQYKLTYLENKLGYLFDFKYRRKFELRKILHLIKIIDIKNSFLLFVICIVKEIYPKFLKILQVKFIDDNEEFVKKFYENSLNIDKKNQKFKNIIYDGYFQNFELVSNVLPELTQLTKSYFTSINNNQFNNLYELINSTENSVALGIRFYEETKDPRSHSLNRSQKKVEDFNKIICKIEQDLNSPHFFIFVQEENQFTRNLQFNSPYKFITHKKGYIGSWERLKAQSLCKHHIFNNSTFYWWGCMFSKSRFLKNKKLIQKIYASDNFIFQEIYDPNWIKF